MSNPIEERKMHAHDPKAERVKSRGVLTVYCTVLAMEMYITCSIEYFPKSVGYAVCGPHEGLGFVPGFLLHVPKTTIMLQ